MSDQVSLMASNPFADPKDDYRLDTGDPFSERNASSWTINEVEPDEQSTPRPGAEPTSTQLDEIRRREQQVAERERVLAAREEHVRNYGKNNWPPFFPLIFHDIDAEIPKESQTVVLTLYRIWLLLILVLIGNMVACILLLVAGRPDGGKDLGASIGYVPIIGATSFLLWYRPIYNAFMKEHALFYYLFFVFGGFHLAFSVYMFVGVPSTGGAGLINTIGAFTSGSIVAGVFGAIATAGWALQGLGLLYEYRAIWSHFNNKGHTFEQAKGELQRAGLRAYFTRGNNV